MKTNRTEIWEEIVTAAERVAAAYRAMLQASDDLADMMGYDEYNILRHVLPRNLSGRRDSDRVLVWLQYDREKIEAHVLSCIAAREEAAQRAALLAKLNLSAEEQRLLGITGQE